MRKRDELCYENLGDHDRVIAFTSHGDVGVKGTTVFVVDRLSLILSLSLDSAHRDAVLWFRSLISTSLSRPLCRWKMVFPGESPAGERPVRPVSESFCAF